jgi:hypothetical protein
MFLQYIKLDRVPSVFDILRPFGSSHIPCATIAAAIAHPQPTETQASTPRENGVCLYLPDGERPEPLKANGSLAFIISESNGGDVVD